MLKRFILAAALAFAFAAPAGAQPPVWVVRDADSTIVLFGSVHLLPPGLDWRPAPLEAALATADDLWFELPFDAEASRDASQVAIERGLLPTGETLSSKLSRKGRKRLAAAAERLGVPMAALERMRPWLAEITLGVAELARNGASGSDGVERSILADAPARATRRAFETPAQQVGFFADLPEKVQVTSLEHTLKQMKKDPGAFQKLLDAWLAGDTKKLEKLGLTQMAKATPQVYRALVIERNRRWTDALAQRLEGSGETVVVVGAAHLIGKDGVPAMLRARGISVEGP
ncbi:MAG TPA: TraB/GumN family protein [Caulobacteraceae bacterium]